MTNFTFKTKEEYLAYKEDWKERYKEISKEIRKMKNARKKYTWSYRPKGMNTMKSKTKTGENPNYNPEADFEVWKLKIQANNLLEERRESKILAGKQMKERLEEALAL